MADRTIVVFDPTAKKKRREAATVKRPSTLPGKRLAVVWNKKPGGDILLDRFSELLAERFKPVEIERIDHQAETAGMLDEVIVNRLVETCDAAVIGTGD